MIFLWIYLIGFVLWITIASVVVRLKWEAEPDRDREDLAMNIAMYGFIMAMMWPMSATILFFIWLSKIIVLQLKKES